MMTGDAIGKSKIGINTSRKSARKASPEIRQPIDSIALFPRISVTNNNGKEKERSILRKRKKGKINNNSAMDKKMNPTNTFEALAPSAYEAAEAKRTNLFQGGDFGGGGIWYLWGCRK